MRGGGGEQGSQQYREKRDGEPAGNVCGYFSSTAERPAYGCFAENRGKDAVGHSFHFTQALASSGRLADAHAAVESGAVGKVLIDVADG